jgi:hypothetical protein
MGTEDLKSNFFPSKWKKEECKREEGEKKGMEETY